MENNPFEDELPIENGGFSIAMLVYRRVMHIYAFLQPSHPILHQPFGATGWGTNFWPSQVA